MEVGGGPECLGAAALQVNREGGSCCSDCLYLEQWRLRAAGASAVIWEDASRQLPGG